MNEYQIEHCHSCRAPVIWARTTTGRSMPVNAAPVDSGTVRLSRFQGFTRAEVAKGSVLAGLRAAGEPLRTSHFATCEQARQWRQT